MPVAKANLAKAQVEMPLPKHPRRQSTRLTAWGSNCFYNNPIVAMPPDRMTALDRMKVNMQIMLFFRNKAVAMATAYSTAWLNKPSVTNVK